MLATVEADKINYHTPDHLGSPRILTDGSGQVISRRDFMPWGDQIPDSIGNRSSVFGYSITDSIRQHFTNYERDDETGLDFAQARHFNAALGRFMQPDEFNDGPVEFFASIASNNPTFYGVLTNPQSLNKYQYCFNNPNRYIDPTGHQGGQATLGTQVLATAAAAEFLLTGSVVVTPVLAGAVGVGFLGVIAAKTPDNLRPSSLAPKDEFGVRDVQQNYNLLNKSNDDTKDANKNAQASSNQTISSNYGSPQTPSSQQPGSNKSDDDEDAKQFKALSKGEIKKLQKADIDPHDLKPKKQGSHYDLFKDRKGNIYVMQKGGKGQPDPTGININELGGYED